ncbi:MAG: hypothetical protein JOZ19_17025 [Rubrobacter sp.]|nr:hypothetical protein [Rubrobacter sp.]
MEDFYSQIANIGSPGVGADVPLLGFLVLLGGQFHQSEAFERLVNSKIRGPLYQAYGTFGLPLMLALTEFQRSRRGGGVFRFLGVLLIVALVVIIGVLALIAFLLYRFFRRRQQR